ncbi:hypothetical protein GQ457_04G031320 [Hibiscus cannabinus]
MDWVSDSARVIGWFLERVLKKKITVKQVYSTISSDSSKLEFWARNSLPLLSAAASKGENAPNYLCIEWMRKITVGYGRLLLFFSETSSSRDTCVLLLSARIGRE